MPMSHAQDVMLPLRDDVVTETDRHEIFQQQAPAVAGRAVPGAESDRVDAKRCNDTAGEPALMRTIAELAAALRSRTLSSVELAQQALDAHRGRTAGTSTRSSLSTAEVRSPVRARPTPHSRAAMRPPLTGIPIAHKDVLMTQGLRTTCGSRMLEHFVAPYDAHVVARLRNAGTVLVGKTNMDEFAMGSSNENSYFGAGAQPVEHSRACPAAVPAARPPRWRRGSCPARTGTDTGGSIRQPAALSGICGLKPTYGVCSRYGLVAFASSLDTPGPLAHDALRTARCC